MYRVRAFSLPIPIVATTATIFLPLITGVSLRGAQSLIRRTKQVLSWPVLTIFVVLIIYETAIATLALAHIIPSSEFSCGLDRRWAQLFSSKNAQVIRRIQDRHHCCGLHSVQDRAWPFPDKHHTVASCTEAFDRQRSCLMGWRQDEQIASGLMLLVAILVFLIKVNFLASRWLAILPSEIN